MSSSHLCGPFKNRAYVVKCTFGEPLPYSLGSWMTPYKIGSDFAIQKSYIQTKIIESVDKTEQLSQNRNFDMKWTLG